MVDGLTTLNIRRIDSAAVTRAKQAAAARNMTIGQYIAALVSLHEVARARADAGDDVLNAELRALGLSTVTS